MNGADSHLEICHCLLFHTARDTCSQLVEEGVTSVDDFGWVSQLRYYWEESWADGQAIQAGDLSVVVKVVNARVLYGESEIL